MYGGVRIDKRMVRRTMEDLMQVPAIGVLGKLVASMAYYSRFFSDWQRSELLCSIRRTGQPSAHNSLDRH